MASELQNVLQYVRTDNYITLSSVILVVYDYLLTWPKEVEYIWSKPWSWISAMFLLVRYTGITFLIMNAFVDTTFIPGPQTYRYDAWIPKGTIVYLTSASEYLVFLSAADLMMILRVYAMWHRSKVILYILLLIYVFQLVVPVVLAGIYFQPDNISSIVLQVASFSYCNVSVTSIPSLYGLYLCGPRMLLSVALLVLAVMQTLNQSVAMYKARKQWQLNQYMQIFVRDGIIYFIVNVFYNTINWASLEANANGAFSFAASDFLPSVFVIMMPRFVISVRELYDRGCRGHCQGVDTGFGVISQHSVTATVSGIRFAGVSPGQGQSLGGDEDGTEEIRLEEQNTRGIVASEQGDATDMYPDDLELRGGHGPDQM